METTLEATAALANSPINIWPVGMIMPFSGNTEVMTKEEVKKLQDEGWFFCDGAELAEKHHSRLFKVLGHTCGGASPNFCVPDLRGVFLRGLDGDGAVSRDPDADQRKGHAKNEIVGNKVLSRQDTNMKGHTHVTPKGSQCDEKAHAESFWMFGKHEFQRFDKAPAGKEFYTTEMGAVENRGVNVSVNYIIFAGPAVKAKPQKNL
jgi:microcystin-dependent protein